jgi:hypothetical protein
MGKEKLQRRLAREEARVQYDFSHGPKGEADDRAL